MCPEKNSVDIQSMAIQLKILQEIETPIVILTNTLDVVFCTVGVYELLNAHSYETVVHKILRIPVLLKGIRDILNCGMGIQETINLYIHDHQSGAKKLSVKLKSMDIESRVYVKLVFEDRTDFLKTQKHRRDFVSYASHELRTPLTALAGFVQILQGDAGSQPELREKFLTILSQQIERLKRLTEGLLSLHKIEMSEHIKPEERIDVLKVVQDVCVLLAPLAEEKNITLNVQINDTFHVHGSHDQLSQVFTNLIDNAIKYSTAGQSVDIKYDISENAIRIDVIDYSIGIPEQHVVRITERFYRVTSSQGYKETGVGLGLSITKHILKRHRGQLNIRSTVGEGSTFSVTLPKRTTQNNREPLIGK